VQSLNVNAGRALCSASENRHRNLPDRELLGTELLLSDRRKHGRFWRPKEIGGFTANSRWNIAVV
jgi:hypothetical protein